MSSILMNQAGGSSWDKLEWRRRLETFGQDDGPVVASGRRGEVDSICNLGELTDQGRETTLDLGRRLRHLYVDRLEFMPKLIGDADMIYLRATPIPRALESVQQSFWGMYPSSARTMDFPTPTIITRTPADETLFPNDGNCRRFSQLSRAFAQRTADRWNETSEMEYLNKLIGKWMPPGSRVAIDAHPRLSGVMDTINSTLAHPKDTRLPAEFYDPKGREIIEKIEVEEWFSGYTENKEYRALGIGALLGDVVSRMVGNVEGNGNDGLLEVGGDDEKLGVGRGGERGIKFAMSGCHDTTLAAMMASLGTLEGDNFRWPPYTSHIALELFRKNDVYPNRSGLEKSTPAVFKTRPGKSEPQGEGAWSSLIGRLLGKSSAQPQTPVGIARKPMAELSTNEREKLDGFYVRLRFNDKPLVVPGCKVAGNHLEGDESFCTLAAFKSIVDKFTPEDWKQGCASNLDKPVFPSKPDPAGV
ncbi:MAG: hypothetical protein M1832_004366 [Thelocarpon impressellum]|nr:MAG: hypothetical protein M1832_004366 [Thelocarpon impressellum]